MSTATRPQDTESWGLIFCWSPIGRHGDGNRARQALPHPKRQPARARGLGAALSAPEADHAFLLQGDVFTEDLIETWIAYKRENEVDPVRLRLHPAEFSLYYDC